MTILLSDKKINVLYLHSKRAKESTLFEEIKDSVEVVRINTKTHPIPSIKAIKEVFSKTDLLFLENPGVYNLLYVLIGMIAMKKVMTRLKGDPWAEYSDTSATTNFTSRLKKILNFGACKMILSLSDVVIPISQRIAKLSNVLMLNKKIYVLGIPYVPLSNINSSGSMEQNKEYALTVTNFNFYKKIEPLDKLLPMVASKLKTHNMKWFILGQGYYLDMIKSKYRDIDNVVFAYTKSPFMYYKEAKIVLYFSALDGLPNVFLETAMHKKAFIINSKSPLINEFIIDNDNGYILNEENEDEICAKLDYILKYDLNVAKTGLKLYSDVQDNFSVKVLSSALLDILISTKETNIRGSSHK